MCCPFDVFVPLLPGTKAGAPMNASSPVGVPAAVGARVDAAGRGGARGPGSGALAGVAAVDGARRTARGSGAGGRRVRAGVLRPAARGARGHQETHKPAKPKSRLDHRPEVPPTDEDQAGRTTVFYVGRCRTMSRAAIRVPLRQRRKIERGLDEHVDSAVAEHRHLPDVHQLRRSLADDLDADEMTTVGRRDELDQSFPRRAHVRTRDLREGARPMMAPPCCVIASVLERPTLAISGIVYAQNGIIAIADLSLGRPSAWRAARRPCSIAEEASAGGPMTSPTA